MRRILGGFWALRWSLAGCLAALALAFLSLGYSSLVLYAAASPLLRLAYPPMSDWHGPWVWPVLVGVGILWAPSFLAAGMAGQVPQVRGWSAGRRRLLYLAVLWCGAVAAWFVMLATNFPPGGRG